MSDQTQGSRPEQAAGQGTAGRQPVVEHLDEAESFRLISPGGVGRLVYSGRFGLSVLPVNYRLLDRTIVFRTAQHSPTGEDLRTGIAHADYEVAFEIDDVDMVAREGWSVLIHGPAHHLDTDADLARLAVEQVEPWPGGEREDAIQIIPTRITGRRIRRIS
jgi:nitroimidazol reductase NimA-like FMN-containing flavoprotein (pyridoxamine 5'-phosphate oxidase superfamily)